MITLHEFWERIASDTVQVFVKNCTQTYASQEFYKRKVEIFPNPATTELQVKIRGVVSEMYEVALFDLHGKQLTRETISGTEAVIDISNLSQGVYGVRVIGNSVMRNEKLLILN